MRLPKYTTKDYMVLLWVILPISIVLNTLIFGKLYFSTWLIFTLATLISGIAFTIDFVIIRTGAAPAPVIVPLPVGVPFPTTYLP